MSKPAVLLSIKPKYCERIANGKKTIEVRKTRPKLKTPFKCHIYCTNDYKNYATKSNKHEFWIGKPINNISKGRYFGNGKVIGEFVCDTYIVDRTFGHDELFNAAACLDIAEVAAYMTNEKMYGWHISDIKIYDEPKELKEFAAFCDESKNRCKNCEHWHFDNDELNGYRRWCGVYHRKPLSRPPQSWCYVEEVKQDASI